MAAAALAVGGVVAWRAFVPPPEPKPHVRATFVPDRANDKGIVVRGWTEDELRKLVADFCHMYEVPPIFDIVHEADALRLRFPGDIDPDLFLFVVNYIHYPKDFDLAGRNISAMATTTLSAAFDLPDEALVGRRATIYVPIGDKDYDVVYLRPDSGAVWAHSFSTRGWKRVAD